MPDASGHSFAESAPFCHCVGVHEHTGNVAWFSMWYRGGGDKLDEAVEDDSVTQLSFASMKARWRHLLASTHTASRLSPLHPEPVDVYMRSNALDNNPNTNPGCNTPVDHSAMKPVCDTYR